MKYETKCNLFRITQSKDIQTKIVQSKMVGLYYKACVTDILIKYPSITFVCLYQPIV